MGLWLRSVMISKYGEFASLLYSSLTDEEAVEGLVQPYFPNMVEAESLRPNPDHAPAVEENDPDGDGVEHGFGGETVAFLNLPEREDANSLGCYAHDEEVGQLKSVVSDDAVLQCADHGDCGIERVAEEEVT